MKNEFHLSAAGDSQLDLLSRVVTTKSKTNPDLTIFMFTSHGRNLSPVNWNEF